MADSRRHIPTVASRAEVKALAAVGVREDEISLYLGIAPKTLRKHYRDELDKSHIQATANVARSLYKQATGGNVAAAIFWMKARGGWREKVEHEVTGPEGGPVQVQVQTLDASALSTSTLEELLRVRKAGADGS